MDILSISSVILRPLTHSICCLKNQKYDLNTPHLNVHSLPDKLGKLKLLIGRLHEGGLKIDILLCETFLAKANASVYQIPGFLFLHKSRQNKKCGGVAIYVREQLNFKTPPDLSLIIY